MAGTGPSEHQIDLDTAERITRRFRNGAAPDEVRGHWFSRDIIDQILAQPGCTGVRIYHARHDDGSAALVVVGTRSAEGAAADLTSGPICEEGKPCPPYCDVASALNSR